MGIVDECGAVGLSGVLLGISVPRTHRDFTMERTILIYYGLSFPAVFDTSGREEWEVTPLTPVPQGPSDSELDSRRTDGSGQ